MRFFADAFFSKRYGSRAVVLETVAAVPGMVGGALQHLRALRRMGLQSASDSWALHLSSILGLRQDIGIVRRHP